ncbi:hypothetical protein [Neorhodopirellula pilleata]|uniref:Uncharacterized protein n=1 Tax=Neorhodopirellula pilleata TaxID=2714738 RepID=A0A5C5ZWX2_9BACT|nr:hypothetical protein [Neorhodopirellula pilleata]TWT91428.1 hypothetical protein Pla100_52780 [Neorhodopirellula pilleata]TWT91477.1 hypothetical protein Pla100_53270 [Neorhodopirellula pilleata]
MTNERGLSCFQVFCIACTAVMILSWFVCGGCLLITHKVSDTIAESNKQFGIEQAAKRKEEAARRAAMTPEERLKEDRVAELYSVHSVVEYMLKPKFPTIQMDLKSRSELLVEEFGIVNGTFKTTNPLGEFTHVYEMQVKFNKGSKEFRQIAVKIDDNLRVQDQQAYDELSQK